ncbi:MAG TPA: nucleotide exchange factor GrpE [Stellaceae bacterium]|nr:nucleotide exchange factor GrpE [Stellaceae bacterium]HMD67165.1 nucleotide exchange factor GrpE [Stellaceae bacterium]
MNDTGKEWETVPAGDEAAANNNVEDANEGEAEKPRAEARGAALETELAEQKDRLLRALAETENVRRRAQREREEASKYVVAGFAKELLSVADNLRRALDSLPESEARDERTRGLLAGVEATERELLAVFERNGIRRVDPDGERFDHNLHQAVFEAERPGKPGGMIIEVLQPGYVLHDRLLRPAMVGVAKEMPGPAKSVESTDTAV